MLFFQICPTRYNHCLLGGLHVMTLLLVCIIPSIAKACTMKIVYIPHSPKEITFLLLFLSISYSFLKFRISVLVFKNLLHRIWTFWFSFQVAILNVTVLWITDVLNCNLFLYMCSYSTIFNLVFITIRAITVIRISER